MPRSVGAQIHRVIPPPAPQDQDERWSLVYFIRPAYDNPLAPLSDQSEIIRKHAEQDAAMQALPKGETAGSWFQRRIKLQRAKNRTGPETWAQSRGTERELHSLRSVQAPHADADLGFRFRCSRCRLKPGSRRTPDSRMAKYGM